MNLPDDPMSVILSQENEMILKVVSKDDFQIDKDSLSKATSLLIPTNVKLSSTDEPAAELSRRNYLIYFVEHFRKQASTKEAKLLFLFHRTDNFTNIPRFLEIKKEQFKEGGWENVEFGTFGGGTGAMYEEDTGLLNNGSANFICDFYDPKYSAAFFGQDQNGNNDKYNVIAIKADRFKSIWDHYWLQTRKRLENLKKWLFLAQIPNVEADAISHAKKLAQSLVRKIHSGVKKEGDIDDPLELNFSACDDIEFWTKIDPKVFSEADLDKWIEALKRFIENEKTAEVYDTINLQFDKLISTW
ncbi:MAG: hypothetical protein AB8H47_27860 [Bacteroidia bacterium]